MKKLMRNDPCWCGSKKPYCECHMDFDKKIEMYRKKFHKVPPRSIIKNEEQLQGMRESSKINIAVLDYVAENIKVGMTTQEIDEMVYEKTTAMISLPGAGAGIEFLLKPDFSKVDGNVFLGAMGQAFFSLSLGMGCLCTYASYFRNDTNLPKTALNVAAIDTMVAILAGFIIFPAAFSVGIKPDAGPSLLFITLPNVFQQAFGNIPWLAVLLSLMFYILLALAALTSTISLHEVVTAYLHEEFKFSRSKAARYVTAGCIFVGVFCSLSLGIGKSYTAFGLNLFDLFDFVTAKLMLPLGGFFISIFIGWYLDKKIVWEEVSNNGTLKVSVYKLLIFILKYIAPIGIALIFINELGFLK